MKKVGLIILSAFLIAASFTSVWSSSQTNEPKVTKAEDTEARALTLQFIIRLSETRDLSGVVSDLYFTDFIERFRKSKANDTGPGQVDLYFAPGLEYSSRLLTEGESKDWRRLYAAANEFLFFGFVNVLKNTSDVTKDIKETDMFPAGVIKLLNGNSILAGMIVRKPGVKAIGTVEEMRAVTATLEQAVAMMREQQKQGPPVIKHKDELIKMARSDSFFQPCLEVIDDGFFSLPKGTRVLFVKTPIGFQLILAREQDRLKVLWSEALHE